MNKSYHDEGPYDHEAWQQPAIMQQYKISTYLNALIHHRFKIDNVIEDVRLSDERSEAQSYRWYSNDKAKLLPTTLIIKCHKL